MNPGGISEQIARSTRRCSSASSVPLSTVSYSSMRVSGRSRRKQRQALQQQPGRKDDLHRQLQLALPAGRERAAGPFERLGLLEQRLGAPVEHFAGRRSAAPCGPESSNSLTSQLRLDFLHCIGDRRLALVQPGGCLRVATGVDHSLQGTPLLERYSRWSRP